MRWNDDQPSSGSNAIPFWKVLLIAIAIIGIGGLIVYVVAPPEDQPTEPTPTPTTQE